MSADPNFVAQEQIVFRPRRAEIRGRHAQSARPGRLDSPRWNWLLEIGVENIAAELLRKRAWLAPALQAKGFTVLHADAKPENASGIVSFFQPGQRPCRAAPETDRRRHRHLAAHRPRRDGITSASRRISTIPTRNWTGCWNCYETEFPGLFLAYDHRRAQGNQRTGTSRRACCPPRAYQLVKRGHQVLVERGAGAGAGYPDADYERAGREAGGRPRSRSSRRPS